MATMPAQAQAYCIGKKWREVSDNRVKRYIRVFPCFPPWNPLQGICHSALTSGHGKIVFLNVCSRPAELCTRFRQQHDSNIGHGGCVFLPLWHCIQ